MIPTKSALPKGSEPDPVQDEDDETSFAGLAEMLEARPTASTPSVERGAPPPVVSAPPPPPPPRPPLPRVSQKPAARDDERTRIDDRPRTVPGAPAVDPERTRINDRPRTVPGIPAVDPERTRINDRPRTEPGIAAVDPERTRINDRPRTEPGIAAVDPERTRINDRPRTGPVAAVDPERTRIKPQSRAPVDEERTRLRRAEDGQFDVPFEIEESVSGEPRDAEPSEIVESALPQGTVVGRYLLLDRIGVGGMGSVYAAYDPELDRKVALKLLHGEVARDASDEGQRGRLLREAQAMAKLSHPAIVAVHEVGLYGDQVFMAMEFVEGVTLRDWIREKRRAWRDVLQALLEAGAGLAAAHRAGLIHRDFKPSNVIIGHEGRVRVIDFGLARRTDTSAEKQGDGAKKNTGPVPVLASISATALAAGEISLSVSRSSLDMQLTHAGAIMGSPAYMSPEQHMSRDTDPRSDQFSFCVALYEGLYGRRPFVSEDHRTLVYAILEQRISPPPRDTKVPRQIHRAVLRGLAVNPADRYESMDALLAELRRRPGRAAWYAGFGLAAAAVVAMGTVALWPKQVDQDGLAEVDAGAALARDAAAKSLFVYPPPDDATAPTAYKQVLALEQLEGALKEPAAERASELRLEFAATLVYLGDRYWEREGGTAFAIDYYAQALVFEESNARARERAPLTIGQLADLRRKAQAADFSPGELAAAEPLLALAEENEEKRIEKLEQILAAPETERSAATSAQLSRLVESEETRAGSPKTAPKVAAKRPARPEPAPDVEIVEGVDGDAPKQERVATQNKRDPKQASQLAKAGHTALGAAHWDEAATLFHRALSFDRRCGAALIGLSDVYFNRADRRQAIDYAERAVAVAPGNSGYRMRLGDAYFKALRYDDAKAEYLEAQRLGDRRAASGLQKIEKTVGG